DAERVADIYATSGRTDQALEFYRVLHSDNPANIDITNKISRIEEGGSIRDLLDYEQFASPSEGIARAFFDLARIFYREYNDESAQIFAQMSLAMNNAQTESKILLAHIQTRHGRYEDAIEYYTSVSKDDPNYLSIQYQSAELLADLNRTDDAIALLNSLAKSHDDIQALIQLGDLYRREENFDMAIKTYSRTFKAIGKTVPDKYWSVYYARGMAYEQMGEWNKAEVDLRKALGYQPNHPYLLNYLGYSLADRGKSLNEALEMIAKAVDLRPNDGYITDSLGWVYYRLGDYEKAVPPLERAVELLPYDPTINDHLGDAYWQVGRKMEAQFQWRRAMNNSDDDEMIATIEEKLQFGLTTRAAQDYTNKDGETDQYKTLNP
ncbi:MAG: tetratricopeptide repeat protein, partial [Pseudomonadota bacterium]